MKTATAKEKKKYKPEILKTHKYRDFKINEVLNKKTNRREFKVRFQMNGREIYLTDESRKNLEETIDERLVLERRSKYNLEVAKYYPPVEDIFEFHLQRLTKEGNRKKISLFERVRNKMLDLLPAGIKFNELKKAHFQKYIDKRLSEVNPQSNACILPETVNKELSAAAVAIRNAWRDFPGLEDVPPPIIPKAEVDPNRRRERLVEPTFELAVLLEYLRRDHPKQSAKRRRCNIADDLEMRYETGFRRSEVACLKPNQYKREEQALRDVKRIKTKTVTKFFPLSRRAVEIIESRLVNLDSEFIFTNTGKPDEYSYQIIKEACKEIGLNYGTFADGGFVPHDLRHNFATDITRVTDIETSKNLTGHSGDHILTYLHTDEIRMREAIRKREGYDRKEILTALYNDVKDGIIEIRDFVERVENLIKNG